MKVKEESGKAGWKLNIKKTKVMATGPSTSWQIDGEEDGNSDWLSFLALQNHCGQLTAATKLKMLAPWKKRCDKPRQHIKKQKFQFADEGL